MTATRQLVLVLGDQLDRGSRAFDGFDPLVDRVLMIEAASEATHVWSHKQRMAIFLSAMRHFAARLAAEGVTLDYVSLAEARDEALPSLLVRRLQSLRPQSLVAVLPGEFRLLQEISASCERSRVPLGLREDRCFYCTPSEFASWAGRAKALRLEHFYRYQRKLTGVFMEGGEPEGGRWNFDADNRASFGKTGPGALPAPLRFAPDEITRAVLQEVEERFANHPGRLTSFGWPVTREDAQAALSDFIAHRLPSFGRFQDAMWRGEPWLYHSLLSAALNLKLLDPREAVKAAVAAYRAGKAPLAAVEGFVRQILGWREFIRGVYWLDMPAMAQANHFGHARPLPAWYWTGATHMACLRHAIEQTLEYGYAHHIQR
jgi:deoxyribodipyrimidine photolyase-related protein